MAGIIEYFDLNRRARSAAPQTGAPEHQLLQSAGGGRAAAPRISIWEQLLMYLGIGAGVLFSSAVSQFKAGESISLKFTVGTIVVSLLVAFVVLPSAFEKLSVRLDAPLLVRVGLFVQHGVFWNVLFAAVGKAVAP
jgi:hypothetical protein